MSPPTTPSDFVAPTVSELQHLFPGYRVEGFIAQGGMGAVYRAHQNSLDRPVAIKILPREFGLDEGFRKSFAAEAKAMARLNHPNLIGVYDCGEVDGMLFMVMEFVDGRSLHDLSDGVAVEPAKAIELVIAICRGLSHAHDNGILHRDIKPANILLDGALRPKVGDFGLARRIGDQVGSDEVVYGTPGYAAPELTRGGVVDNRADVFSIGALLHRLLTGVEPGRPPLPSAAIMCGSPPVLDRIISRATQKNPGARYADADELAADLVKAKRLAPRRAVAAAPSAAGAAATSRPAPARRFSVAGMATLLVVCGIVIGAIVVIPKLGRTAQDEPERRAREIVPVIVAAPEVVVPVRKRAEPKPVEVEPVQQALARLKDKLAAGVRVEFPAGTVARNGSAYLVLNDSMTWSEAEAFAEDHGAHLAVLPAEADRDWFREQFPLESPVWLGAGLGADQGWQWIDGSSWSVADNFSNLLASHERVAFSKAAGVFPTRSAQSCGVALQWREDGTNPATIEAQLKRMLASAGGSGQIAYPLGTRTREDSHYFRYEKALRWDEARKLAESTGGYLAVPSTTAEHLWMCETFATALKEDSSLWLGGYRLEPGERWQWLTREGWNNSGWQTGQPKEGDLFNRVALWGASEAGPAGWAAGDGASGVAEGLLIEWSPPRKPVAVASFELNPWLESVNQKIASRVESDLDQFAQAKEKVVQDYLRAMNRIVRKEEKQSPFGDRGRGRGGFGGFGNSRILEEIEPALKERAKNNELLASLPFGASKVFREQQAKSESEVKLLEETYDLKVKAHLAFYLDGLAKKAADLGDKGYLDVAREIERIAENLEGDPFAFVELLFPGSPLAVLPWTPKPADEEEEENEEAEEDERRRGRPPGF